MAVTGLITHSGKFHADDVFAASILRALFPQASLERTRDEARLNAAVGDPAVVLFDVGHKYSAEAGCFDHHQWVLNLRGPQGLDEPAEARRPNGVPYASFGLVWRAFGADFILTVLDGADAGTVGEIASVVERTLIEAIDAADCGDQEGAVLLRSDSSVCLSPTTIGELVADMNPEPFTPQAAFDAFLGASDWAGGVLARRVQAAARGVDAARHVRSADDGGPLLILDRAVDWRSHTAPHHLYVVFPESGNSGWLVQAVSRPDDPFSPLRPFPAEWAGLRNGEFKKISGVMDAGFCHAGRFIAGAGSREGACTLARLALGGVR
jgi:uncharacterized UPF0160 family protein